MRKISAVGLFCCDKFEETPKQKVIDLSKLNKFYFKTEFMCFILFANRFLNKVLNRIKTFYPVREQVSQRCYCFFILLKNVFIPLRTLLRNLLVNRIKHMNSVFISIAMSTQKDLRILRSCF